MSTRDERQHGGHKRECRVRRMLKELELKLERNPSRNKTGECYGRYRVVDLSGRGIFGGNPPDGYSATLDTIESYCIWSAKRPERYNVATTARAGQGDPPGFFLLASRWNNSGKRDVRAQKASPYAGG